MWCDRVACCCCCCEVAEVQVGRCFGGCCLMAFLVFGVCCSYAVLQLQPAAFYVCIVAAAAGANPWC